MSLVLDANILMRAVLGKGTRLLLAKYAASVDLVAPETAFQEAGERLPGVFAHRQLPPEPFLEYFESLSLTVRSFDFAEYSSMEGLSRWLMAKRDEDDWPVLAAALTLNCPIWTEDTDFFGCGVATWTTDRVEIYLEKASIPFR